MGLQKKVDDDAGEEAAKAAASLVGGRNLGWLGVQQNFSFNSKEHASVWEHLETHLHQMKIWKIQIETVSKLDSAAENRHDAGCWVHVAFVLNATKTRNTFNFLPLEKSMSHLTA
jgi:hypothetical protein